MGKLARAKGRAGRWRRRRRTHPDSVIAGLAARQHNVVARAQLVAAGLTPHEIDWRLKTGHLHALFRGVHVVGSPNVTQQGRWMAAVLAAGQGAVLSHRSAAALWGLIAVPDAPIEVIAARGSSARRRALVIHRSSSLSPADLTTLDGIPVTAVARTLVDLATRVSERRLREAFYRADGRRLLDRPDLLRCLQLAGSRRGSGVLRELGGEMRLPLADANPGLERGFIRFCAERGLPMPEVNAPLGDFKVDCLWLEQRLVVELDSWEFHRGRDSFEADRRRDAWLQLNGFRVVRVTHRRMTQAGDQLERELRALLHATRAS